jgi:hypothetical protein
VTLVHRTNTEEPWEWCVPLAVLLLVAVTMLAQEGRHGPGVEEQA